MFWNNFSFENTIYPSQLRVLKEAVLERFEEHTHVLCTTGTAGASKLIWRIKSTTNFPYQSSPAVISASLLFLCDRVPNQVACPHWCTLSPGCVDSCSQQSTRYPGCPAHVTPIRFHDLQDFQGTSLACVLLNSCIKQGGVNSMSCVRVSNLLIATHTHTHTHMALVRDNTCTYTCTCIRQ